MKWVKRILGVTLVSVVAAVVALAAFVFWPAPARKQPAPLPPPVLASGPPAFDQDKTDGNLAPQYAQTLWPTGHRDGANTDYVPTDLATSFSFDKRALEGHPIFWPPITGPDGTLFVTTGKGPGGSHLFALSQDGEILWESAPEQSLADLDAFAIMNAPVIDAAGDVYVGDRNQLWSFHSTGKVKWVAELEPYGVDWGFMTVVITPQGRVGGVTTNGKVIFFDKNNGKLAMPVLDLPGGKGPPAKDKPPGDLWKGLMDPSIVPFLFNLIQGWELEVANTPAIHPQTGRLYITAAGQDPDVGMLYAVDFESDRLKIAFQTPMGGGSGTSPAISHDGKQVYALDEHGRMAAIDAHTGEPLWLSGEGGGGSASPSVGIDEKIYTAFQDHIITFTRDGSIAWKRSYNDFCANRLDKPGGIWGYLLSEPVAFVDSILTVGKRHAWLNIVCGNSFRLMPSRSQRTRVPIPRRSLVVALDLSNGAVVGEPLVISETSEGFVVPLPNGRAVVSSSGAITSIFYYMLNRVLPEGLKISGPPKAGLLFLETK